MNRSLQTNTHGPPFDKDGCRTTIVRAFVQSVLESLMLKLHGEGFFREPIHNLGYLNTPNEFEVPVPSLNFKQSYNS